MAYLIITRWNFWFLLQSGLGVVWLMDRIICEYIYITLIACVSTYYYSIIAVTYLIVVSDCNTSMNVFRIDIRCYVRCMLFLYKIFSISNYIYSMRIREKKYILSAHVLTQHSSLIWLNMYSTTLYHNPPPNVCNGLGRVRL